MRRTCMSRNKGHGNRTQREQPAAKPSASAPPHAERPAGRSVLPPPEPKFNGTIGRTYKDSTMGRFPIVQAPAGAPNVLLVLYDDCGFGQWGTFGGQVPTPNLDRLA